jgi:hypothetical protein
MPMSDSLTASELERLRTLLQRFTDHDLDQFDNWRFDTRYGPVFVLFTRELPPGWSAEAFTPMPSPAHAETGRFARVRDTATVNSREGALRVIKQMQDDLAGAGAGEWENPNLERFLDALYGFLAGLDGYYANRGQEPPTQADWGLFATALVAASGYE